MKSEEGNDPASTVLKGIAKSLKETSHLDSTVSRQHACSIATIFLPQEPPQLGRPMKNRF